MLLKLGRFCFAVALACFALQYFAHLLHAGVPAPGAPWASGPGFLEPVTAISFLAAAVGLMIPHLARLSALLVAAILCSRIMVFHVAVVVTDRHNPQAWANLAQVFAMVAGAFALAAVLLGARDDDEILPSFAKAGAICFSIFLVIFATQQFYFAVPLSRQLPPWMPYPLFWTYFAAWAMVAAILGLLFNRLDRLTAMLLALMFLFWTALVRVPIYLAHRWDGTQLTSAILPLALAGGCFAMASAGSARNLPLETTLPAAPETSHSSPPGKASI